MRINHNIAALNTNRQLAANNTATSKSLARLSSGLRINSAADDAAGLAISEKMRGQISGLDQASSNANDGISMIQTAEGALSETHSILQRMRELAVQASNDTNTSSDRAEMQKEIDQLSSEITRISTDTEFNTKKLLDGSMASTVTSTMTTGVTTKIAAGASIESGVYNVAISNFVAEKADTPASTVAVSGSYNDTVSANYSYLTVADNGAANDGWYNGATAVSDSDFLALGLTVTGTARSGAKISAVYDAGTPAAATAPVAKAGNTGTGTMAVADVDDLITALGANFVGEVANGTTASLYNQTITVTATDADTFTITVGTGGTAITLPGTFDDGTTLLDAGLDLTPATAMVAGDSFSFTLTPSEAAGAAVTVKQAALIEGAAATYDIAVTDGTGAAVSAGNFDFKFADSLKDGAAISGNLTVDTTQASKFQIGANSGQNTTLSMNNMSSVALGVNAINLNRQDTADAAITTIDAAITSVSSQRAALGAAQNRLEHTIANLGTSSENLSAAESQIRDVDMAKEMTEFTKNNILSQAAQSMLAQANQQPQSVLQLLQ